MDASRSPHPNLLRDLFAEARCRPPCDRLQPHDRAARRRGVRQLANKVVTLTAMFLTVLALLGMLIAPWLVALFAPASTPTRPRSRDAGAHHVPVHRAGVARGTGDGLLNAKNVFGMPAMASASSTGLIAGGVILGYWLDPHFGPRAVMGLAVGTLTAARCSSRCSCRRWGASATTSVPTSAGATLASATSCG
jgi:putative peptidoglycan lipid II flippase